jgi:hypothetical protein
MCDSVACPCRMSSSNSPGRGSSSRSRRPPIDSASSHVFPQPDVSPAFFQSPSSIPQAFPFPTPQFDRPSEPSSLLPPNWQRPRATSSYASESSTLAFPEPQLYRSTSTRAPSPPPRTSRHDLDRSPLPTPPLPPRNSATSPKTHSTEVASKRLSILKHVPHVLSCVETRRSRTAGSQ